MSAFLSNSLCATQQQPMRNVLSAIALLAFLAGAVGVYVATTPPSPAWAVAAEKPEAYRGGLGIRFTGRSGSGFQPAMVRAHSRACALSVMPGTAAAARSQPRIRPAARRRRGSQPRPPR